MRKKLDTRFPAARIKKIMQADEDIGKIAMAVPLLVSKALELFLQDLCDRTYEITLKKGAKTVNSLHLKQCVQSFNVFDFLKDTVSRVPDLGGSDAAAAEDRSVAKRRKISEDEEDGHEDESKRAGVTGHPSSTGRGRGRGRGKGRGRGSRQPERESTIQYDKFEEDPDLPHNEEDPTEKLERPENVATSVEIKNSGDKDADKTIRNFDLNIDLNENADSNPPPSDSARKASPEMKHEEIPGWSLEDVQRMAGGSVQFATLNGTHHEGEEEEDYDEE